MKPHLEGGWDCYFLPFSSRRRQKVCLEAQKVGVKYGIETFNEEEKEECGVGGGSWAQSVLRSYCVFPSSAGLHVHDILFCCFVIK